ncbi:hypothetical protein B484DRAFT_192824 [Ochromonadaceae sp. CCMP2298]|nr:hypothetical protein B484DRAFT_192824 [Ochromonadaceae sp. CCMP2298]
MVGVACLTPFQGSEMRVFGHFRCSRCVDYYREGRERKSCAYEWSSGVSWRDTYQNCQHCQVRAYPYAQRPLRTSETGVEGLSESHKGDYCGRCTKGRPCYAPFTPPSAEKEPLLTPGAVRQSAGRNAKTSVTVSPANRKGSPLKHHVAEKQPFRDKISPK